MSSVALRAASACGGLRAGTLCCPGRAQQHPPRGDRRKTTLTQPQHNHDTSKCVHYTPDTTRRLHVGCGNGASSWAATRTPPNLNGRMHAAQRRVLIAATMIAPPALISDHC